MWKTSVPRKLSNLILPKSCSSLHSNENKILEESNKKKNTEGDKILAYNFFEIIFPKSFLSKFSILEQIGQGNQATVFKVQNKTSKMFFAAKVYQINELEKILMIRREAAILKEIESYGIITVFEYLHDEEIGIHILLTEYFPSICLQKFIKEHKLTHEEKIKVCKKITKNVRILHSNAIAHRDLTLSNILICPKTLKINIIDFGLSRNKVNCSEIDSPEGNPSFRPPPLETISNFFLEDLWSLGLIILSVFLNRKINTKMGCNLISKLEDNLDIETAGILKCLKNLLAGESRDFLSELDLYFTKDP